MPRQAQLTRRRTAPPAPEPDDQQEETPAAEGRTTRRRTAEPAPSKSVQRRQAAVREDDDDDDETYDEAPQRGGRKRSAFKGPAKARESGAGFDKLKQRKAKASRFNVEGRFTVEEKEEELILFLAPEPFETWNEHFFRELDGKKSFTCLDEDCPLCETGATPSYRAAFNIVTFDAKGNPEVKFWIATPGPLDEIEEQAFGRNGPLDKPGNYYVVSKKKKTNGFFDYKLELLSEEQVEAEFGFEPLSDEDIDALMGDIYSGKDVVSVETRGKLREIARELD